MNLAAQLVELEALLAKATPGDWRWSPVEPYITTADEGDIIATMNAQHEHEFHTTKLPAARNASLVVWLVNNAPSLLRAAAARQAELEADIEFVARWVWTKPESFKTVVEVIQHHPTIKAILQRWVEAEPAAHWITPQLRAALSPATQDQKEA